MFDLTTFDGIIKFLDLTSAHDYDGVAEVFTGPAGDHRRDDALDDNVIHIYQVQNTVAVLLVIQKSNVSSDTWDLCLDEFAFGDSLEELTSLYTMNAIVEDLKKWKDMINSETEIDLPSNVYEDTNKEQSWVFHPYTCDVCNGIGLKSNNRCFACNGEGVTGGTTCSICRGEGWVNDKLYIQPFQDMKQRKGCHFCSGTGVFVPREARYRLPFVSSASISRRAWTALAKTETIFGEPEELDELKCKWEAGGMFIAQGAYGYVLFPNDPSAHRLQLPTQEVPFRQDSFRNTVRTLVASSSGSTFYNMGSAGGSTASNYIYTG